MRPLTDHPLVLFAVSFPVLWLSTRIGAIVYRMRVHPTKDSREDFNLILGATLTLLALIIGFSFSMAISRYDQRKTYEEAEANAIGTEYVRADLLPGTDAGKVRLLLRDYLDQRILYYATTDNDLIQQINVRVSELQSQLWSAVVPAAQAQPTPVAALILYGMNDVLNSQGYTQAAWWNRIPQGAWILMLSIAVGGTVLLGYGVHSESDRGVLLLVLPCVLSVAFLLIADIDSPHGGVIRVSPQNLQSLAASLRPH
jgi:hypothetical protein